MAIVYQKDAGLAQGITALGQALGQGISQYNKTKYDTALNKALKSQEYEDQLRLLREKENIKRQGANSYLNEVVGMPAQNQPQLSPIQTVKSAISSPIEEDVTITDKENFGDLSEEQITKLALSPYPEHQKLADLSLKQQEANRRKFEADRKYNAKGAEAAEKKAFDLRETIPKKTFSQQLANDAVRSKDVGIFSLANLAQRTGINEFQTAKGAQLVTAGKENLLSNMARVSAKGQNIWFEQRLNSMFPQIGQSEEANETISAMLEGELELDKNWLEAFDRLSKQDMNDFGYIKKDIAQRVGEAVQDQESKILDKTMYKTRAIYEKEQAGRDPISWYLSQLTKKVPHNTPLTKNMIRALSTKYDTTEKIIENAKKLGYKVLSKKEYEEFGGE